MRVCLIEAVEKPEDAGSIGVYFIEQAVKRAGHTVERIAWDCPRYCYDVELISVHHPANYAILPRIPRHARIRIIGGHVTYTNPRPIIPLCDAVCLGDGEAWIVEVLAKIDRDRQYLETIDRIDGGIVTRTWQRGAAIPPLNIGEPNVTPYLHQVDRYACWEIEIARGCPYQCAFCEIGHTVTWRTAALSSVVASLEMISPSQSRNIRVIAPEEATYPHYKELCQHLRNRGFLFVSNGYRIDALLRASDDDISSLQHAVRIGIDGLSEASRIRAKKPLTNAQILECVKFLQRKGCSRYKFYQMYYPWDTDADFDEWEQLFQAIINANVRGIFTITWTPLFPLQGTPFAEQRGYNQQIERRIRAWHRQSFPQGVIVSASRIYSRARYEHEYQSANLDETGLLNNAVWIHPTWRKFE